MRNCFLFFLLLLIASTDLLAQGELDTQETVYYNDEKTWAFNLATAGYNINYRQGRRINYSLKRMWAIELGTLSHPKEYKVQSQLNPNSLFVYGKLNAIMLSRFSLGYQKEIFRRIDKDGIAIRWFYLGGATVVWQKPIYYNLYSANSREEVGKFTSQGQILGKASYFKGFSESTFVPGGHIKTGMGFDFSKNSKQVMALEVGVALDVFIKPLEIMAVTDNPFYYVQVYAGLRYGRIVDRMKVRLKKTRREMERKQKE